MSRTHLLGLDQYFRPEVEATANLLADRRDASAADHEVTVLTGRLPRGHARPRDEIVNAGRDLRTLSTAWGRAGLSRRSRTARRAGSTSTTWDHEIARTWSATARVAARR